MIELMLRTEKFQREGDVWSSEDAQGPQHRLQTARQVALYGEGVTRLITLHRLPSTAIFRYPRSSVCRKQGL
eukprot:9304945-Pyramimonas_sp.AAC.1